MNLRVKRELSIVTGLRAERSEVRIPIYEKEPHLLQKIHTDSVAHPASYSIGTGGGGGEVNLVPSSE
jgi:hypothetical protein